MKNQTSIRLSGELDICIRKYAKREHRTFSNAIEYLLWKQINEENQLWLIEGDTGKTEEVKEEEDTDV